ncbi:MAG: TerC family protein [Leptospiraceae bacterium]|nr:TerC family protein [Leptospiraceae bacterium]
MLEKEISLFVVFNLIVVALLAIDLGLLGRKGSHKISIRKASIWSLIWISVSFLFAGFIFYYMKDPSQPGIHKEKAMEFIAGYLLEKSLSVDNLFVFIMIFQTFKISSEEQPDVLKWGIIGAVILRAIMIFMGAALIKTFGMVLYIFGFFLIYTAIKMALHKEEEEFHPENSKTIRFVSKLIPVSKSPHGGKFFLRENGKLYASTLFIVLVLVEVSDVMFAFDSIPAIFSVTKDPFIVYTSNIFAILGLRALYFLVGGIMDLFIYLKTGVIVILAFVGIKMLLPLPGEFFNIPRYHIPIHVSLSIISLVLCIAIFASIPQYIRNKRSYLS